MSVTQIATIEPIDVAEAKKWLLVDYDDQDEIIDSIIKAARMKIERRCGISISMKKYKLALPSFSGEIELPNPPVISVDRITYLDGEGVEKEIPQSDYELVPDDYVPTVIPASKWPTDVTTRPNAVRIEFTTGIDIQNSPPDDIPEDLKQAMRLVVGEMYENRQDEMMLPTRQELGVLSNGVLNLISPYIVPRL